MTNTTAMRQALESFIAAGWALAEVWDESAINHDTYASCISESFDEFLTRFATLMDEPDGQNYASTRTTSGEDEGEA